ncbi:MAG TPA: IS21 family transposase [Methylomirabilota bacterium]
MANLLSDAKKQQVLALGQLGWTLRRIQAATGVRRETAGAYLKAAGLGVRPAGRWGHPPKPAIEVSTDPVNPASEVSTDFGVGLPPSAGLPTGPPSPSRAPTASACEPYRELIELAAGRGRNAVAIWRDLVDDHGFPAQYASVRRFVGRLRGPQTAEAHPIIVTAPGEEGQVDYGDGPMVRHPVTGKYRRTRLFVFTLGYSRKSVRLLTFTSSTRGWCELHEEAFRRLGGTVQVIVLDNLREGVLTADIYDPALNPLYRDMLAHYGVVALPCRVGDPDRKGKVESAIGHTQAALKGLRFETLEAAQAYLDRWDARWADTRIHGTTKRQVAAMFTEERPALRPLPVEPFRYYQFGRRTVHLDNCIEVDAGYYSAPPGWLGQEVAVQWDASHVRLLDPRTGQLLREHRRHATRGRHAIHPDDRPPRTPPSTLTLLAQAARAGTHIGPLCAAIHRRQGEPGVRRILGVLSLVKKHGAPAVDAACAAALELDVADYRFVRRYVERHPAAPLTLRQVDPLIRELTHYRDVIAQKTQEAIPT